MTKYNLILSLISGLFLIIAGILVWRASVLFTDFASMFPDTETGSELALNKNIGSHKATLKPSQMVDNSTESTNFGHYETIEETITRIKRDVYVTGTIISAPGEEVAFFQIEGMPDRAFKINTQLMDGFIITEITNHYVVFKNQIGDETFSIKASN